MDLLDAGRRRRWMSAAAAVLLVVAAVVVVALWLQQRGGPSAAQIARQFLEARSCERVRELADASYRARPADESCQPIIDGARGRRTFGDPDSDRHLDRTLSSGDATTTPAGATQVRFTAHYTEDGRTLPDETVVVVLDREGDRWRVDDWGLAS